MTLHATSVSIKTLTDRRGRRRFLLNMPTNAENALAPQTNATVHNISQTGLLLEAPFALNVGEVFQLNLPAAGNQVARVVWADNGLHGCKFDNPIPQSTLSAAIMGAPFDRSANGDVENVQKKESGYKLPLRTRFLTIVGLTLLSWGLVAVVLVVLF